MSDEYKNPKDHGYWDGDVFVFTPPITLPGPGGSRVLRKLDLSKALLADLVTPQDVVTALLNPIEVPSPAQLREMSRRR